MNSAQVIHTSGASTGKTSMFFWFETTTQHLIASCDFGLVFNLQLDQTSKISRSTTV